MSMREVFCQAPFLFLCVALGIFPSFLLDWMGPSIDKLMATLAG